MPSRKQRRRREKLKRHEYEYVIETEDGEVPVERLRDADTAGGFGNGRKEGRGEATLVDRRGRPLQKPTLSRVLRRAAIFAPLLFVFVYLTTADRLSTAGMVFQTLILIAFFIPFSYLVDLTVYRLFLRRHEREQARKRSRG